MSDLFKAVSDVTTQELNNKFFLPSMIHQAVKLLGKVYFIRLMFKDYEAVNKVEGIVLGTLSSKSLILKVVLIASLTENILRQYESIYEAYRNLTRVINRKYPIYHRIPLNKYCVGQKPQLSASLLFDFEIKMMRLWLQSKKILCCVGTLVKEVASLSMSLTEVYLICQGDSLAKIGAFTRIASDYSNYKTRLSNNNEVLVNEALRMETLIQKILINTGVNKKVTDLVQCLGNVYQKTKNRASKVAEMAEEFVEPIYKKGKVTPIDEGFEEAGPNSVLDGFELPMRRFPPWSGGKIEISVK